MTRALVSEPVVYRSDLTDGEIEYLNSQEQRLRRLLRDTFGLTLETRAEGWVAVDTEGGLTDESFPSLNAPRAAALAVVDASRARRSPDGTCVWSADELTVFVAGLHSRFSNWPLDPGDEDGAAKLAVEAAQVLVTMRLARPADEGALVVLVAAGRFALAESPDSESGIDMGRGTDQSSDSDQPAPAGLFDQETTP